MNDIGVLLNIIVLLLAIGFAMNSLYKSSRARTKKDDEAAEVEKWERGAQMAGSNEEYRSCAKELCGLGNEHGSHPENTDRLSEANDKESWRFTMPHAATDLLIECFSGDEQKAYLIKRSIELSIEHLMIEMADDGQALRIVDESMELMRNSNFEPSFVTE